MTDPGSYLRRRAKRLGAERLRRLVIFAQGFGWIFLVVGVVRYYLVPNANDALWLGVSLLGAVFLGIGVVLPEAIEIVERMWMAFAHRIGALLIGSVLAVVYVSMIVPVGLLMQLKGRAPFYAWGDGETPTHLESWRAKANAEVDHGGRRQGRSTLALAVAVFAYFGRRRAYIFLPVLVVLIVIGMLLFFAQTSALAPFIYTLF